jgi:AAA domain
MIELQRTNLLTRLDQMSQAGSLVVVGGPGSGKSWLLREFAARHEEDGALLILAEEHNYVESLSQLEQSLNIPAGFIATLKRHSGSRKLLIIDSMDALRAEASQRVFRQLIRQVHRDLPEWRVVVSIRSFDAKESLELQRLFPQTDIGLSVIKARHLVVLVFNDEEIEEAKQQDSRLVPIFASASERVQDILRNAFNLWLVIHLLDEKVGVEWLYQIESEVQLFERYWHYRIGARADSHDRLSILSSVSSQMVSSRTLSIPFSDAYRHAGISQTFQSLLSDEVLHKTQTQRIAYAHNILFDFSVSKLLLDEERLFPFLKNPDRSIFFRPSISYFLALLWYRDRDLFWNVGSRFFGPESNLPARVLVLPGIAVFNSVVSREQFEPLLALEGDVSTGFVLSVLRAVQAFGGMTSQRCHLWVYLLSELSTRLDITFLNEYIELLEIASQESMWTFEEKRGLMTASIRLLTWMWSLAATADSESIAEQLLSIASGRVIPVVARFYPVDPDEVRKSLRGVLDRIGRPDVSASEVYSLANCLETIIDIDPSFAVDVYAAAFAHEEKSRKTTQLGGSKVLVMTSTRAQDYSMSYYILGVRFNHFLTRNLNFATLAAIRSVSAQVRREHVKTAKKIGRYSPTYFNFAGLKSKLVADRSELWDQGYRDNVSLQMLNAVLHHIAEQMKKGQISQESVWSVFRSIAKENEFPVTWKRVIELATHTPELLPFGAALLEAPEILAAPETTVVAGDLIAGQFKALTQNQKQQIETAIWAIPELPLARTYRSPIDQRDRLLACIPEEELSARSREVVQARKIGGTALENRPFFKIGSVSSHPFTQEDWLRDQGVNVDAEPSRTLLDAKAPLAAFEVKYLNGIPSIEEINEILPALQVGFELVTNADTANPKVVTDVLTSVAASAKSILKNTTLDRESAGVRLSHEIVVKAATYPHPEPDEKADEHFDRPGWGPTPKIEAAQGIMLFACNWGLDEEVEKLITTLIADKSPAVRFQIVDRLGGIYERDPELFWLIAESMRNTEKATGVLVGLARIVGHAYITKREPERVVRWFKLLLRRRIPKQRPEDVYEVMLAALVYLSVSLNNLNADEVLRSLERFPLRYAKQLHMMADSASYYLEQGLETGDSTASEVRERARALELRVLTAVDRGFQAIEQQTTQGTTRGAAKRGELVKQLLMTVDRIVFRLHMIIRANPQLASEEKEPLSGTFVRTFFRESTELWEAAVGINPSYRRPMGPSTAHNLMGSFNRLLPIDPERVLKLASWLITGRTFGYQFDQMAIQEFVRFAESILADHKALLHEEVHAVRFAEILNVFVSAGWPQATRIVMRMDAAVR